MYCPDWSSHADHRRRVIPDASRIAPAAAHPTGARTAKRRSSVPPASSRSSTPSASTATPAISEVGSGLRVTGRVSSEFLEARAEVELPVPAVRADLLVADAERPDADVGLHQ